MHMLNIKFGVILDFIGEMKSIKNVGKCLKERFYNYETFYIKKKNYS